MARFTIGTLLGMLLAGTLAFAGEPRVSIQVRDADIQTVLRIFARQSGFNVSVAEGVEGIVTLDIQNLTYPEALDSILLPRDYSWYQVGKSIVVRAEASKESVRIFQLRYARSSDVAKLLEAALGEGGIISENPSLNSITVKVHPSRMTQIARMIQEVDGRPKQVLVEAKIVELKVGDESNLGVDLVLQRSAGSTTRGESVGLAGRGADAKAANPKTKGFFAQAVSTNWEAYVETLKTRSDFDLLSSPKVVASNHEKATINVGDKIGYLVSTSTQVSVQQQVQFLDVGTKLEFTPHMSDGNNDILMEIRPEVSEGALTAGVPFKTTTETSSRVVVRSGQSIVIGGLIRNKERQVARGIPILMDLPFVGVFFRRTEIENEKREILVFITPKIIESDVDLGAKDVERMEKRSKDFTPSLFR